MPRHAGPNPRPTSSPKSASRHLISWATSPSNSTSKIRQVKNAFGIPGSAPTELHHQNQRISNEPIDVVTLFPIDVRRQLPIGSLSFFVALYFTFLSPSDPTDPGQVLPGRPLSARNVLILLSHCFLRASIFPSYICAASNSLAEWPIPTPVLCVLRPIATTIHIINFRISSVNDSGSNR